MQELVCLFFSYTVKFVQSFEFCTLYVCMFITNCTVKWGCLYSLDWTTGLDYWTDLLATTSHFYAQ